MYQNNILAETVSQLIKQILDAVGITYTIILLVNSTYKTTNLIVGDPQTLPGTINKWLSNVQT